MPFTSQEFKFRLGEIAKKHQEWFSRHPPLISDSAVNSIHDHYYVYMTISGYQLRFNASSDLPVEIRNEIRDLFEEFNNKKT